MSKPLFSIVTVCYNSEATIEDTLLSVFSQSYPQIEYIIVDGKSTDSTLTILEKYKNKIAHLVSEKDNGIYDAINKGIDIASGKYVAVLNSDDFYINKHVIENIVNVFGNTGADAVYGDLQYVDRKEHDKVIRNWKSGEYKEGMFIKGWMPPHPSFFVKKECYTKYGKFNTILRSAADYELMLRFIHVNKIKVAYLPEVLVKMRVGGVSNNSILNRIKANREDKLAWELNKVKPGMFTLIRKPLSKLSQFFKKDQ